LAASEGVTASFFVVLQTEKANGAITHKINWITKKKKITPRSTISSTTMPIHKATKFFPEPMEPLALPLPATKHKNPIIFVNAVAVPSEEEQRITRELLKKND
jgi:hypothetical protein